MMQSQYQAGVRLSFGFSRSRRGTLIQDSMRLMMLFDNFSYSRNYPQPLPLIIAGFTIFAPMNRLSGVMRLESASCPHRANPKGIASPKGLPPRKESISEWNAIPKGNASQKGLLSRKESISERTALPKGNQSRKEPHPPGVKSYPERKRIPREERIVTLCWKVLAFSAFS